jgi:hypothetical protein
MSCIFDKGVKSLRKLFEKEKINLLCLNSLLLGVQSQKVQVGRGRRQNGSIRFSVVERHSNRRWFE